MVPLDRERPLVERTIADTGNLLATARKAGVDVRQAERLLRQSQVALQVGNLKAAARLAEAARRKKTYPPWIASEFHWRFERIHPFEDGNGRIGRILMNAILQQGGFMPVFFDARNTVSYSNALCKAMKGHPETFASFLAEQTSRTVKAMEEYSAANGSVKWARHAGPWKEPRGKLLVYDEPGML